VPEYPDVIVYLEALDRHVVGNELLGIRIRGISVLKSYDPPINAVEGMAPIGTADLASGWSCASTMICSW